MNPFEKLLLMLVGAALFIMSVPPSPTAGLFVGIWIGAWSWSMIAPLIK